jgi:hypothetical protein
MRRFEMKYMIALFALLVVTGCNPAVDDAMQGEGTTYMGTGPETDLEARPPANITGSPEDQPEIEFQGAWPGPDGRPDTVPPPAERQAEMERRRAAEDTILPQPVP